MSADFNDQLMQMGFRLSRQGASLARQPQTADLERTLLAALLEAQTDARLFSLLCSWVKVHGDYVIVEKLGKLVRDADPGTRLRLSALACLALEFGMHKWKKLIAAPDADTPLYQGQAYASALRLKGPMEEPARLHILIPQGSIRIREADVLSAGELLRQNRQYRNRYLYGASWRADIITAIEEGERTPAAIARRTGCSYEPAYRIQHEYSAARSAAASA